MVEKEFSDNEHEKELFQIRAKKFDGVDNDDQEGEEEEKVMIMKTRNKTR